MCSTKLPVTVDAYNRHVVLCAEDWPARVEGSESDPLPELLSSTAMARNNDITIKTKLTVSGGGGVLADGDVLIFPDMIKYRGLKESNVDSFVDDVIVNSKPWASGAQEVLTGPQVFVGAHGQGSRDCRWGVCGPVLIDKFIEEADLRGLKDQISVSPCSHIGGHKYAGSLISFSPGVYGMITGYWYGCVALHDVHELVAEHIGKGQIIGRLWSGQMGLFAEEAEKASEHKLPNGESEKLKDQKLPNGEEPKESKEKPQENFFGCCQGANGVSCCRDGSLEQTSGIDEKKRKETTESTSGKKSSVEHSKKMKFEEKQSWFKQVPEEKGSDAQVIETKRKFEEVEKSSVEQSWTGHSFSWLQHVPDFWKKEVPDFISTVYSVCHDKKKTGHESMEWSSEEVPDAFEDDLKRHLQVRKQIDMNQSMEFVEADQEMWMMREGQMPVGNEVDGFRVSNGSNSLGSSRVSMREGQMPVGNDVDGLRGSNGSSSLGSSRVSMREGQMPVGNDVDGLSVSNGSSPLGSSSVSMMSIDASRASMMSIDPSRASMMSIDPSRASMMSIDPSRASMMSIDPSIGSN